MAAVLSPLRTSSSPSPDSVHSNSQITESPSDNTPKLSLSPPSILPSLEAYQADQTVDPTHSQSQSRHTSAVFPLFHSSLPYALVRDFAYQPIHPLHYGPLDDSASDQTTPSSTFDSSRRTSDPPSWGNSRSIFGAGPWGDNTVTSQGEQLPSKSFGSPGEDDYSDDENTPAGRRISKHRKSKSYAHMEDYTRGRRRDSREREKKATTRTQPGLNNEGMFTAGSVEEDWRNNAAGNSSVDGSRNILGEGNRTNSPLPSRPYQQGSNLANSLSLSLDTAQAQHPPFREDPEGVPETPGEEHRPGSTSLDESYAGPSLALYEFKPENDNELALREGQIIQVGYRHGQGWLVAMNLETGEQGLVPEEYVRLLRDIEGWGEDPEDTEPEGSPDTHGDAEGEEDEETSQSEPSESLKTS